MCSKPITQLACRDASALSSHVQLHPTYLPLESCLVRQVFGRVFRALSSVDESVDDLFKLRRVSAVTCTTCGYTHFSEAFGFIDVFRKPLEADAQHINVNKYLNDLVRGALIDCGSEEANCEGCGGMRQCRRQCRILHLGKYLLLDLSEYVLSHALAYLSTIVSCCFHLQCDCQSQAG